MISPDETKYLRFTRMKEQETGKTQIWEIRSLMGNFYLGRIKWYSPWRQYCYWPPVEVEIIIAKSCLIDIEGFIQSLTLERKK